MSKLPYSLSFEEFKGYASQGNLIPIYREILADLETPVSAFRKIDHGPAAYLLESVEGGESWARYSFLGSGSPIVIQEDRGQLLVGRKKPGGQSRRQIASGETPFDRLQQVMSAYRPVMVPGLP